MHLEDGFLNLLNSLVSILCLATILIQLIFLVLRITYWFNLYNESLEFLHSLVFHEEALLIIFQSSNLKLQNISDLYLNKLQCKLFYIIYPCLYLKTEVSKQLIHITHSLNSKYLTFHHMVYPSKLLDLHSKEFLFKLSKVLQWLLLKHLNLQAWLIHPC
jgi:hypothetical protein